MILIRAILLLLCLAVAAEAGVSQRDGKTIITVVVAPDIIPAPGNTSPQALAANSIVRQFQKDFPDIFRAKYRKHYAAHPEIYGDYDWDNVEIVVQQFSGVRVEGVEPELLAIAGDMAPDVLLVNFRRSDNYIRSGLLYPLDRPEDGYLAAEDQTEVDARVYSKIWPVIRRAGREGDTHVWALPTEGPMGKVLLYRKDLFDRHGLSYPDANWTWEDLYHAARVLTDPKKGTYGIRLGRGQHEAWFWMAFLWSAGGEAMQYDPQLDQWRTVFDSWEAAKALDFYVRLSAEKWVDEQGRIHRGYADKDASSMNSAVRWVRGDIGMMFDYVNADVFSSINPELVGMAPVPLGPPDDDGVRVRGGELNSRMIGLFSRIKHPAVRDAAWEFIWYLDTDRANAIRTRELVEGGMGQFVNPKALERYGYPEVARLSPPGWAETFQIAIDTGRPEPYGRNSTLIYALMTPPIHEAEQLMLADQLPADPHARLAAMKEILERANAHANRRMIGLVTPRERVIRNITAAVVLTCIVVGFAVVFRLIVRAFTPPASISGEQVGWGWCRYRWAYLLLAPALLAIGIFSYFPLAHGSLIAFQDYEILLPSRWVFLSNFGDVLWDNTWWNAVWNSLRYSLLVMALTFFPPILLAILLQEVPRGSIVFRTVYYLPAVVSGLVVMILWKQFYDKTEWGVLNRTVMSIPAIGFLLAGIVLFVVAAMFARRLMLYGQKLAGWGVVLAGIMLFYTVSSLAWPILMPAHETLGVSLRLVGTRLFSFTPEPYRWLDDPDTAMLACVIPMVWAGIGPGCLIYLAALKGIAEEYYEAADLDGANFLDKILFVVFPTLKPLILINFLGVFVQSWTQATSNVLVMTGGGADTLTAGLWVWYMAFRYLKFGPATAAAWMLGFMLIGFTVYQLRILARLEFRTTGAAKSKG